MRHQSQEPPDGKPKLSESGYTLVADVAVTAVLFGAPFVVLWLSAPDSAVAVFMLIACIFVGCPLYWLFVRYFELKRLAERKLVGRLAVVAAIVVGWMVMMQSVC